MEPIRARNEREKGEMRTEKRARKKRKERKKKKKQCSGSVTYWDGSGSADPYLLITDSDPVPDPALFVNNLQDANKKMMN